MEKPKVTAEAPEKVRTFGKKAGKITGCAFVKPAAWHLQMDDE